MRDVSRDLLSFAGHLGALSPKAARLYMSATVSFLEFTIDGFEMTRRLRMLLRDRLPKGSRPRTVEAEVDRGVIQRILNHCDEKGRALFLLLASSGMRVGEALQLRPGDVNLEADPPIIWVRAEYTKAGDARVCFITGEAKAALLEWLRVRDAWLQGALQRGRGLRIQKRAGDDRVFPLNLRTVQRMWANALRKAGLESRDPSTKRRTIVVHSLRKFFNSALKAAGMPEDVVEALMGHMCYLDAAYRRYGRAQLAELYKKYQHHLYINVPPELSQGQHEIKGEMQALQNLVLRLTAENEQLKQKLASIENLESRLEELERRLGFAAQTLTSLRAPSQSEEVEAPQVA